MPWVRSAQAVRGGGAYRRVRPSSSELSAIGAMIATRVTVRSAQVDGRPRRTGRPRRVRAGAGSGWAVAWTAYARAAAVQMAR